MWWRCYYICACVVRVLSCFAWQRLGLFLSVVHGSVLACVMRVAVVCLCVAQSLSVKAGAKSNHKLKSKTQKCHGHFPAPFPGPLCPGLPGSLGSSGDHAHHSPRSSGGGTWCCALFLPAQGFSVKVGAINCKHKSKLKCSSHFPPSPLPAPFPFPSLLAWPALQLL